MKKWSKFSDLLPQKQTLPPKPKAVPPKPSVKEKPIEERPPFFCNRCGTQLEIVAYSEAFDPVTGEKVVSKFKRCPLSSTNNREHYSELRIGPLTGKPYISTFTSFGTQYDEI